MILQSMSSFIRNKTETIKQAHYKLSSHIYHGLILRRMINCRYQLSHSNRNIDTFKSSTASSFASKTSKSSTGSKASVYNTDERSYQQSARSTTSVRPQSGTIRTATSERRKSPER